MKKILILHAILAALFLTSTAFSQQTDEIPADKKAVISEIIKITKAETQTIKTMKATLEQMNAAFPMIVNSIIDSDTTTTPAEKKKIKEEMIKRNDNFSQRFNTKFLEAFNFAEFAETIYYPLYAKFFSTEELKDLLEFYKTPTGQKFNSISPQFSGEAVRLTQMYIVPKIEGLMKEIINEDLKNAGGK